MFTSLTQKITLVSTLLLFLNIMGCQDTVGTESPVASNASKEEVLSSSSASDSLLGSDKPTDLDSTLDGDIPTDLDSTLDGDISMDLDSLLEGDTPMDGDSTVYYSVVDMRPQVDNWMTLDSTQLFQTEIWFDPGDRMELKFPGIASDSLVFHVYLGNGEKWDVSSLNGYFYSKNDDSVGMWFVGLQSLPEEDIHLVIHRLQQDQTMERPVDLYIRYIPSDKDDSSSIRL